MSSKLQGISVQLPLVYDPSDGPYRLNKDLKQVVKQNLKNLILTSPGERVMIPDFGVGARRMLFEPMAMAGGEFQSNLARQLSTYMPFVNVQDVQFITNEDDPTLKLNEARLIMVYNLGDINDSDILIITEVNT